MRRFTRLVALGMAFGSSVACTSILGSFDVAPTGDTTGGDADTADGAAAGDTGSDAADASTCPPGQELRTGKCVTVCRPGGNECGAHGTCVNGADGFTCQCNTMYAGPACGACASGFQDDDTDGVCKPTCATANLTCPAKATCSTATGTATCTCPVGYALDATPQCVWTGVVKDPTFQGTPAAAWSVQPGGAMGITFDPTGNTSGVHEPGYAVVSGDALCTSSGPRPFLTQSFDMPTPAESGPMALTISSSASFPGGAAASGGGQLAPTMGGPGVPLYWNLPTTDTFVVSKTCLGELSYGKGRSLSVFLYGSGCPVSHVGLQGLVDFVDIAPDATCPAVGKVFNGDFEAGASGWLGLGNGGNASVVSGAGTGGSWGGVVSSTTDCDSASLQGLWSVPLAATLPKAALHFNFKGSGMSQSARLRVDTPLGSGVIAANMYGGGGSFGPVSVCVPEFLKGQAGSISIEMPQGTTCTTPQPDSRQFVFDDFQLVTDAQCPAQTFIADGDFENVSPGTPWVFSVSVPGMVSGAVMASGTNHYGSISATRFCNDATMSQLISVPPIPNGQFYKVSFLYRTKETGANGTFTLSSPGSSDVTLTSTGGGWVGGSLCIGSGNSSRATSLTFRATPNGGANCGDTLTTQTLDVDDVSGQQVVTCP